MPKREGKTIEELLRVGDITGSEIIPMSVFKEEYGGYVTRGITVNDFFKTLYNMIQKTQSDMAYYVSELQETDSYITTYIGEVQSYLEEEIAYQDVSYQLEELKSYTYTGIGDLSYSQGIQDEAISTLAYSVSYNAFVNTIQSGYINTIYFENSTDAFNDWSNPDDDNVEPQH